MRWDWNPKGRQSIISTNIQMFSSRTTQCHACQYARPLHCSELTMEDRILREQFRVNRQDPTLLKQSWTRTVLVSHSNSWIQGYLSEQSAVEWITNQFSLSSQFVLFVIRTRRIVEFSPIGTIAEVEKSDRKRIHKKNTAYSSMPSIFRRNL